jgi:hypothetical protein
VGIPRQNIFLYERFPDQIDMAGYHAYVPNEVNIVGIESQRPDSKGNDKSVYLDRNFFGEEETRSYLANLSLPDSARSLMSPVSRIMTRLA